MRKAFTYSTVVEVDKTYAQIVREDAARRRIEIDDGDVERQSEWLSNALSEFPLGATVIYLDGWYLDIGTNELKFEGLYAHHDLQDLPHKLALTNPASLRSILGERDYWLDREVEGRQDDD